MTQSLVFSWVHLKIHCPLAWPLFLASQTILKICSRIESCLHLNLPCSSAIGHLASTWEREHCWPLWHTLQFASTLVPYHNLRMDGVGNVSSSAPSWKLRIVSSLDWISLFHSRSCAITLSHSLHSANWANFRQCMYRLLSACSSNSASISARSSFFVSTSAGAWCESASFRVSSRTPPRWNRMQSSLFGFGILVSDANAFCDFTRLLWAAAWAHVLSSTVGRQICRIIWVFEVLASYSFWHLVSYI